VDYAITLIPHRNKHRYTGPVQTAGQGYATCLSGVTAYNHNPTAESMENKTKALQFLAHEFSKNVYAMNLREIMRIRDTSASLGTNHTYENATQLFETDKNLCFRMIQQEMQKVCVCVCV
jgi:hypothetical protein